MHYYGLIGHPLSHSFSKAYFEDKFKNEALDCFFINFDIENLDSIKDIIIQYPDLQGFTTTHPYKKAIFKYLSFIDDDAKAIGAVNVVKIDSDKKMHGFNTDYIGFQGLLDEATAGKTIKKAYVCGTGGASEAVKFVLKKKGRNRIKSLGYDLSAEEIKKVRDEFTRLSEKKEVSVKELETIIATCALQVPETYSLVSFSVNSSNVLAATASVVIKKGNETL